MSLDYLHAERQRVAELLGAARHKLGLLSVSNLHTRQLSDIVECLIGAVGILAERTYPPRIPPEALAPKRRGRPPKKAAAAAGQGSADEEGD